MCEVLLVVEWLVALVGSRVRYVEFRVEFVESRVELVESLVLRRLHHCVDDLL